MFVYSVSTTLPFSGELDESRARDSMQDIAEDKKKEAESVTGWMAPAERRAPAVTVTDLMWLVQSRKTPSAAQPLEDEVRVYLDGQCHVIILPQNWTPAELRKGLRTAALEAEMHRASASPNS